MLFNYADVPVNGPILILTYVSVDTRTRSNYQVDHGFYTYNLFKLFF
jgi:hypothetical protein